MRIHLALLLASTVLFNSCKKDSDVSETASVFQATEVLQQTHGKFYELASSNNYTPQQALMLTADWLQGQEGVASVNTFDSLYIDVVLNGGLQVSFNLNPVDDNGYSLFRGGGASSGNELRLFKSGGNSCTNAIPNDKVLIYAPAANEFYAPGELASVASLIGSSSKQLDVTVLADEFCRPESMANFGNYGWVIIDAHGKPESIITGLKITTDVNNLPTDEASLTALIKQQIGQTYLDMLLSGELKINADFDIKAGNLSGGFVNAADTNLLVYDIYVTTKYIKKLPKMPNTIIFGNMCYSGYGTTTGSGLEPIRTTFLSLDPISYYGYTKQDGGSTAVTDWFAKKMEQWMIQRLVMDVDSTEIAHLKPDNTTEFSDTVLRGYERLPRLYFKHYGDNTYCYTCGGKLKDARDGQEYETVCIGNQVWMAENLNYNAPGSLCYDGAEANCTSYGRLYNFNTIMAGAAPSYASPSGVKGVCPQGWHVPSEIEWQVMLFNFGADSVAGAALRETTGWDAPNTGATNESGFNAKPAGYYNTTAYLGIGEQASWWTTTPSINDSTYAIYVTTSNYYKSVARYAGERASYLSCRCVKD